MPSPAQTHRMRVQAAQGTANAAPGSAVDRETSNAHRLIRVNLAEHRRRLRMIQSIERKIEAKREFLDDYNEYVEGVLSAGVGVQDDVLGFVMTWRMDVGDFRGAFDVARYVLAHGLSIAEQHSRTPATVVAEEPAVAAIRAMQAGQPFDVAVLREANELTASSDMPDQVRARLLMATGQLIAEDEPEEAVALLKRAVQLHDKVGAKKDIERLECRLRSLAKNAATTTTLVATPVVEAQVSSAPAAAQPQPHQPRNVLGKKAKKGKKLRVLSNTRVSGRPMNGVSSATESPPSGGN
jgi:Phage small terminase subunit.